MHVHLLIHVAVSEEAACMVMTYDEFTIIRADSVRVTEGYIGTPLLIGLPVDVVHPTVQISRTWWKYTKIYVTYRTGVGH